MRKSWTQKDPPEKRSWVVETSASHLFFLPDLVVSYHELRSVLLQLSPRGVGAVGGCDETPRQFAVVGSAKIGFDVRHGAMATLTLAIPHVHVRLQHRLHILAVTAQTAARAPALQRSAHRLDSRPDNAQRRQR